MVKIGAQVFTYGTAFLACGLAALVALKFTKSDEEKIRIIEQRYGKPSFSSQNNEKMQAMLNNIKEGKVDQAQERQFRELMGRGSDSTDSRTNNLIKNDKRTGTPVVAAPMTSNTVPAATPAVAATTPEK